MKVRTVVDWTVTGEGRNRSTKTGYANPDIARDLAEFAYGHLVVEMEKRGWIPQDIAVCGVDNSSSVLGFALIQKFQEKYGVNLPLFWSGRKPEEDDWDGIGDLNPWGNPKCLVMLDDDVVTGRACSGPVYYAVRNDFKFRMFCINVWLDAEDLYPDLDMDGDSRFYFAHQNHGSNYLSKEHQDDIEERGYVTNKDIMDNCYNLDNEDYLEDDDDSE